MLPEADMLVSMRAWLEAPARNTSIARVVLRRPIGLADIRRQRWPRRHVKPALDRLANEAAAFEKLAHTGHRTRKGFIIVRMKPSGRNRLRYRRSRPKPSAGEWKESEIISLYGISVIGGSLHEIRQVISVDGKTVEGEPARRRRFRNFSRQRRSAKIARASASSKIRPGRCRHRFRSLILVFASGGAERYEFTAVGPRLLGTEPAKRIASSNWTAPNRLPCSTAGLRSCALKAKCGSPRLPRGRIRIMLSTASAPTRNEPRMREEASVDYARQHVRRTAPRARRTEEDARRRLAAENIFDYKNFQNSGR